MPKGSARAHFRVAGAALLLACGATTLDLPSDAPPAERWQDHFDRGQRFEKSAYLDQAQRQYELALEAAQTLPADDRRALRAHLALADLHHFLGRTPEAERHYLDALEIERAVSGEGSEAVADALNALGVFYTSVDRLSAAQAALTQALGLRIALYGPMHPATGTTSQNVGEVHRRKRELEAAEFYLMRALHSYAEAGPAYQAAASLAQDQLAKVYAETGRYEDAEMLLLNAIRLAETTGGDDNPELGAFARDLGDLYARQKRFAEAETQYRRALETFETSLGPDHPQVRRTLIAFAEMLERAGYASQGLQMRKRAAELEPGPP